MTAVSFVVRSTIHTTLQATPAQLVFGKDFILNIPFTADWRMMQEKKQKLIEQNTAKDNAKRIPYQYQVGNQVKILQEQKTKYGQNYYKGPCQEVRVGRVTVTLMSTTLDRLKYTISEKVFTWREGFLHIHY